MSQGPAAPPPEPAPDLEETDPGLAHERTELAWTRSSISFAALGVLILKFRPAVGVPILVFSAVVWSVGRMPRTRSGSASRRVAMVTVAITTLAVVALVLTIAGHSTPGIRL